MSRYRLYPTLAQEQVLLGHCGYARYVWNLAVEQRSCGSPAARRPGSPSSVGSSPRPAPPIGGWRRAA
jgi:hypothetical protein